MASAAEPAILNRTRQLVEPALRSAVASLQPQLAAIAEFHFGWADEHGNPQTGNGGKGVRAALAVLSAEAVGGQAGTAVPGAVAVELVHNFSLLHDDIIDGDTQRRHRPTVWTLFGQDNAIIAGDAMHTLAFEVLLKADPVAGAGASSALGAAAASHLATATAAMIAGQISDMSFNERLDVSVQESLAMEADKTGALLGYAASVGAVLAGAPSETIAALESYGQQLGLAFQAADDLLGIWGDPAVTGKPAGNDLREKKKSLPVVFALSQGSREAGELRGLLSQPALDDAQVAQAATLIERCGGREWASQTAGKYLQAALDALESIKLESASHGELVELANFVIARDH